MAVALPAAGLLAACGDDEPAAGAEYPTGPVTLTFYWWGGEARAKLTDDALNLYTKAHPNVTITRTWQAFTGYYDKLATISAGGNAPDIFQIDDNGLAEYASRNVTLDLSPYTKSGAIDVSKHPKSLTEYGQLKGKQVAIATGENTPAIIYDKTILTELGLALPKVGMTYEEIITWGAEVSAKKPGYWGLMDPSSDYKALWLWLRAQGKEFYSDNKIAFSEADLIAWFQLWVDARAKNAVPPADVVHEAVTGSVATQLVVTKKAAVSFMWSNQLSEMQKATKNDLAMTAYPGDPKGQWARASTYWAASRTTKNAVVVADLINFLVNNVEAGKVQGVDRGLPSNLDVRTAVSDSLTDQKMKDTVAFENEITPKFGPAPAPPPKGHSGLRNTLRDIAETVTYGKATPEAAAKQFFTQAAAALA
ncbi:multiple sugar transport system substrate-binding protein [Allocatelliglobosispora scoriae]|uniref:Multiple sugar transport system substrate-binding protein n=1 Tax=Allocatelliglobosispora scoriae TaxID=643052 RepID=A0A841BSC7_9ACTN|nr:extracellular solute-binding protein [Allocatelliglobosispora scoriae]MBB5870308.1 multiple sugar transport system substrate-binding protein [Allocatelliglobosispora scoriae]